MRVELNPDDNSKILRTRQYNDLELNSPDFVGSFESGEFVYFVFREIASEVLNLDGDKSVVSRIARVCKRDEGEREEAFLKIEF